MTREGTDKPKAYGCSLIRVVSALSASSVFQLLLHRNIHRRSQRLTTQMALVTALAIDGPLRELAALQ